MKWIRWIPVVLLALALPGPGGSQVATWTVQQPTQGWIGFYYDFSKAIVGGQEKTVVVVSEVVEESPASTAGLLAGDTLTHLDGRPVSRDVLASLGSTLEPGDVVRMTVSRGGRSREVMVEAAERPAQITVTPDVQEMVVHLQALRGDILKNLDSLQLSIANVRLDSASGGGVSVRILRAPPATELERERGVHFEFTEPFVEDVGFGPEILFSAPGFTLPFEAFLVESEETAVLKEELTRLRKELTEIRRQELSRRRELAASIQGPIDEILRTDEKIRELRTREAELEEEQDKLAQDLRHVSEEQMQRQWAQMQSRNEEALVERRRALTEASDASRRQMREQEERAREMYELQRDRFGSPVLIGQSFILGAQLAPLNPDLGEYFHVDEGVFVVGVMEDTPAFEAGLKGGDVIIRVSDEEVASLSDLRFGLGSFEGPLRIRVIRKGDPVEILIRR